MTKQDKIIFNKILKGGATLSSKGYPCYFKTGYQVSREDLFTTKQPEEALKLVKTLINKIEGYIGIWVDVDGTIYIDISINIKNMQEAKNFGKQLNQISIYDWANNNCIYL